MEQKSKKIDVKIIIILLAIVVIAVVGIVIFASNKGTPKGLQAKDCIGTWESTKSKDYTITLYEGGTGKQTNSVTKKNYENSKNSPYHIADYTLITWEIKDNILNITLSNPVGDITTGYKVENGIMTSIINNDTVLLKK